jgi:hypothetical protein
LLDDETLETQNQIRNYMTKVLHKMVNNFILTKSNIWLGGRASLGRDFIVNSRKLTGTFLSVIKRLGQGTTLEDHLLAKPCDRCGLSSKHAFTEAPLHVVFEAHNQQIAPRIANVVEIDEEDSEEEDAPPRRTPPAVPQDCGLPVLSAELAQRVQKGVAQHSGDLMAIHLIVMALCPNRIPTEWMLLSPLTVLAHPGLLPGAAGEANRNTLFTPLLTDNRSVLLLFLSSYLSQTWLVDEISRRQAPPVEALALYQNATANLRLFIAQAVRENRLDTLIPFLIFFNLLARTSSDETVDIYQKMAVEYNTRASQQQIFLGAVAEFINLGESLQRVAEAINQITFVERTEFDKLFYNQYQQYFVGAQIPAWIADVYRRCASIIG